MRFPEVVGEEDVAAFRAVAPQAEYVDVPNAAHMVAGDRNDVFTGAVVDFLDRHRPHRLPLSHGHSPPLPGADGRPTELGEALAGRAIFVPPRPQSRRGQPQVVFFRGADGAMQLMGDRRLFPALWLA